MHISQRIVGGVVIIDVQGRITAGEGVETLRDKVNSLLHQGHRNLILNLSAVDYLDSAGLGEIVGAYATVRRQTGSLKLVGLTSRIRDLLSNVGYEMLEAVDGLAGVAMAESERPDLILMDIQLPGIDGYEATRRIRAIPDLAKTPIIDQRGFDDRTNNLGGGPLFGIHQIWRSFALRERLDRANGNHANHVLWRVGSTLVPPPAYALKSLLTMDRWLANIEADKSDRTREQKVANNKPLDAFDFCVLSNDPSLADPDHANKITDFAACDAPTPPVPNDPFPLAKHASPRQVAGGPVAENILKCQLKQPIDFSDPAYGGKTFTQNQQDRLHGLDTQHEIFHQRLQLGTTRGGRGREQPEATLERRDQ